MGRLDGKVALCTASAQGIGLATALAFAKEGARVIASDINISKLEQEVKDVPGIEAKLLNVADKDQVTALVDQLDRVDILFNCAGIVPWNSTILDCDEATWDQTMDVNLKSMYFLCRAVIPKMVAQGSGSIINMSSSISNIKGCLHAGLFIAGAPMRFAYSVSKAGVNGLTKAIAADFITKGVRCNSICPAAVDTPALQERINAAPDPVKVRADIVARQKIGRMGKPEEIAALALYLASDESAYTTGQELVIDGGWDLA
ncbi:dehydrogenase/reductase SDR family member 6-like isoform X1 [Branchiostoma lanceolatum]|uniref:dehydrogenase/reductase SDR family member 6-like isoform X1 n=1 Tax=Branchiostoma lanceolatum TaxID=7740 RepID=UPI003452D10D